MSVSMAHLYGPVCEWPGGAHDFDYSGQCTYCGNYDWEIEEWEDEE
jgi:hypothetical protein